MNTYGRLRGVILLVVCLFFGVFAASRAHILWQDYRATLDQAGLVTQNWASLLEQYTSRAFETGDLIGDIVVDLSRDHGGVDALRERPELHKTLADLARRAPGDYLFLVDRTGTAAGSSLGTDLPSGSFADRAWFQAHALSGREHFIGPSIVSRVSPEILFTFTRKVTRSDGSFDGVFQMGLRSSFFEGIQLNATIGRRASFALWRTDGELIGRTGLTAEDVARNIRSPALARAVLQAPEGVARAPSTVDGIERILAYRVIPKWNIVVSASIPVEVALEPWRERVTDSLVFFALIGSLTALGGGWALISARRVEAYAQHLHRMVRQKENLLREMHHRVKNNLQIVMSLMRMGARRTKSKPVVALVADMEERVFAMSLVFEMVYRSSLSGDVNMRGYMAKLVDAISASYATEQQGVAISLAVEEICFNSDRLGVAGLLVTELVTNALKHAFPEQHHPRIDIRIRQEGANVVMHVADNGCGFEHSSVRRSLGMTMIAAFVQQLEGVIDFDFAHGTHVSVRFPLQGTVVPDAAFPQAA